MTFALTLRSTAVVAAASVAAALTGAVLAARPALALGLIALAAVFALAFLAPVTHLTLLVGVTALVPFHIQNQFGISSGPDVAGVIFADLLLATGLVPAALFALRQPLDRRRAAWLLLIAAFLAVAVLQFVHGIGAGRGLSDPGAELRVLLGLGAFVVALPIVADPGPRRRLLHSLAGLGLLLGIWGVVQWITGLEFAGAGDFGVREGVSYTSAGRGQIQGGLYAFPVAVLGSLAVLISGAVRSQAARGLLLAVLLVNGLSLVLTYERTFWVATAIGIVFILALSERAARARGLLWAGGAVILLLGGLATAAPRELTTARERLLSLGQYSSDGSLRFRIEESRRVIREIGERPLTGSGLGASVWWGRPWENVPPRNYTYAHNGYLWLSWRAGIPAALFIFAVLAAAVVRRGPPLADPLLEAARTGARAALLTLLVVTLTFPTISALGITFVIGVLVALCTGLSRGPRAALPA